MPARLRISLLAPVAALALVGCGSGEDGTIPEENGNELLDVLDSLQSDVSGGSCDSVPGLAEELALRVGALPAEVDPEVKSELVDATANLQDLSQNPPECADSGATGADGVEPAPDESATEEPTTEEPVEPPPDDEEPADQADEEGQPTPPDDEETDTPTEEAPSGGGGGSSQSGGITGAFDK